MKITILSGPCLPVPPLQGGATEKLWHILGQKFAEAGHEVTHVSRTWTGLPDRELQEGVRHIRIPGFDAGPKQYVNRVLDFRYALRAASVIPRDSDVVVTNTFSAPIVLPWRSRAAIYVLVGRMPKGQMRLYWRAARLQAPSSAVAQAIAKELPANQADRIKVVPLPLPFEVRDLGPVDWLRKEKSILYCGRLHPEKGLHLLNMLASRLPSDWRLDIVGPWQFHEGGGGEEYLKTLQETLGVRDNVRFHGPVYEKERLFDFYQRASLFVYPSVAERGETFGLAPLEAMAWGCVPVVSNLQCFKDFIFHGMNGMSFDHRASDAVEQLASALLELISNPSDLNRLAQAALEVRNSHAPERIAQLFLEDFRTLIDKPVSVS
ncbi:glycosyltransferase family 4 protein [Acidithiobacillus sp. YTS05]|uniref:Glycosyltransferase family 4 protein n=1 Tax=Igneacidithiobacillus copahuensis TaxID=2724909 RepID=A0AAE2YPE0_9PROT|nr:glycosyltransferase family 4 protein [Igneacidithiobacillus copahuensis]MBU2787795.1 glycosyltransferase family 4 protein [Igneacidithiobacillus copahuensis]MBU2797710.1 glycosyltransferase family 4 protein [Acidithiobacillus sp. VAN18-2]UTV81298.1 glycosyltransferase family 4 protein [Acidithiobacillus sp. YTS05]